MQLTENPIYQPGELSFRATYRETGGIKEVEILVAPRYILMSLDLLMNRNEEFVRYSNGEFTFNGQVTYKVRRYDPGWKGLILQRVFPAESDNPAPRMTVTL